MKTSQSKESPRLGEGVRAVAAVGTSVSRLEDDHVGVERVRLPAGEVPPVTVAQHTLGLNVGGSRTVQYLTGGRWKTVEIAPGSASFFPAGTQVAARWTEDSDVAMISIDPLWVRRSLGGEDPLEGREALLVADRSIESLARRLLREAGENETGRELALSALGSLIAVDLARHLELRTPEGEERLTPRQVRRITDKVRATPGQAVSLEELAAEVGLSVWHFARAFRRTLQVTPADFVRRERIREATDLLRKTSLSMQEIARRTGFATPSHFTQTFRRYQGVTPREFRGLALSTPSR